MVRRIALLGLCLFSLPGIAKVSAQFDKNPVLIGETLTLTISSEDASAEPDLAPLEQDFQILGRNSSSQFQWINGRSQRSHDWRIQLRPRRPGTISIPPLTVGRYQTPALSLQVRRPDPQSGEALEAFIETDISQSSAYVREQLLLSTRLYVRGNLLSGSLTEPASDRAVIEQLGEQSERQEIRGRYRYRVIERRYVVFAEQSGTLNISAPVFNGEIADGQNSRSLFGFTTGGRGIYASGEPLELTIKPQAPNYSGAFWLPATDVSLSEELSPAQGPWKLGEPLTRIITLRVQGQLHTQLPDLDLAAPAGAQHYTEPPENQTLRDASGLTAVRRYSMAVIPNQAGQLELPPIRLPWWDLNNEQMRLAELPSRQLSIHPAPAAPASLATPPAPATVADPRAAPMQGSAQATLWPWQFAALTAMAGWLGTLIAWWWQTRRPASSEAKPAATTSASRKQLVEVLRHASAGECRSAMLRWARTQVELRDGLLGLQHHTEDVEQKSALAALDAAAFGRGGDFPRDALIAFVSQFRGATNRPSTTALPKLYPE